MKGLRYAIAFAVLGIIALAPAQASCPESGPPSYANISRIYFRSDGVTAPIVIHSGAVVQPGNCPVRLVLDVTKKTAKMGSSPACFAKPTGERQSCCGAQAFETNDSPESIFDRLVAVLASDHFFSFAKPTPAAFPGAAGALYSIVAFRCSPEPDPRIATIFFGPPQAGADRSILTVGVSFGFTPEAFQPAEEIKLFDDFTRAIYESTWNPGDVW
jgi:hypothetical protein